MHTVVAASFRAFQPLAVLLYGVPGSGKGTLGKMLSQVTAWPHISTGDLLRKHIATGTPAGQASLGILSGGYAPDAVVDGLVADRIALPDCQNGIILDGYPRTREQAARFLPLLRRMGVEPLLVRLHLDYTEVKVRLQARRLCSACGAIFNLVRIPPQRAGVCDYCGKPLTERLDDQVDCINRRLENYLTLTEPVAGYLGEHEVRCWQFSGSQAPKDILASLLEQLKENSLVELRSHIAQ